MEYLVVALGVICIVLAIGWVVTARRLKGSRLDRRKLMYENDSLKDELHKKTENLLENLNITNKKIKENDRLYNVIGENNVVIDLYRDAIELIKVSNNVSKSKAGCIKITKETIEKLENDLEILKNKH